MPETIILRGAHIRYCDIRLEEGGAFCRSHMTAEFTQSACESMEWRDPGDSVTSANLEGALMATHVILTPGDRALAAHELQFDCRLVDGFKLATLEENESKRRELRFIITSSAEGAGAKVENYIRRVGDHQGQLRISYTKQEQLDLQPAPEPKPKPAKSGCTWCDATIPTAESDDAVHVNGFRCAKWPEDATAQSEPSNEEGKSVVDEAPTLAAETTAERKKARKAEDAKKRKLRVVETPAATAAVFGICPQCGEGYEGDHDCAARAEDELEGSEPLVDDDTPFDGPEFPQCNECGTTDLSAHGALCPNRPGWPQPNEHGVYPEALAEVLKFGDRKQGEASISILQIAPDAWIGCFGYLTSESGSLAPLVAHDLFGTREEALVTVAAWGERRCALGKAADKNPAEAKKFANLEAWFIQVGQER